MKQRVNVILNGKRELSTVIKNLKPLFESDDTLLLYTKSEKEALKSALNESGIVKSEDFDSNVSYDKFNEYKADDFKDGSKRIIAIRIPQSLFKSIPHALNDILKFVDTTGIARFVHVFYDDLKITNTKEYGPDKYEWYMDEFDEPLIVDPKMNRANFSFAKLSPRFIYMTRILPSPVSFYQFEGRDHFIIDRSKCNIMFDEKMKRLYMIEYIIRAHANGFVKHLTFYPDPVIGQYIERDAELPITVGSNELMKEYQNDDKYIRETLKLSIAPESSVDPIIDYMTEIIKQRGSTSDNVPKDESNVEVCIPEVM